ncbi:unnamed protein product [Hyaloperonospora brassicae]|uniref:3-dehydroquinate dehydratase n=1 Tax=Hyaloperonospora brassicae TaxID=162125 RepID=A0AAV0TS82_HYABA|nr:unnamed protein product [Hyaloperonospora brassicae]
MYMAHTFRRCRGGCHTRPPTVPPLRLLCLFFSSQKPNAPLNLFEIDLKPFEASVPSTEKLTLDDAKRALALQQTDAQHEIDGLHDEMSALFGEEVAEYEEERLAPSTDENAKKIVQNGVWTKDHAVIPSSRGLAAGARVACGTQQRERCQLPTSGFMSADVMSTKEKATSGRKVVARSGGLVGAGPVDVLLLHGPCSFVRDVWTVGDVKKAELWQQIHELADDLKIVVESRNYNSEKRILESLLEAQKDQVIVLYWNISLSKSPFIVRALELIQSKTIIVSPGNIEHGPLPASVVGVLSGFRQLSLSLAFHAAAKLLVANAREGR